MRVVAGAVVTAALVGGAVLVTVAGDESSSDGPTLADAVVAGDYDLARSLLAAGAPPDEPRSRGYTPLLRAALLDDAAMVQLLIDAGADLGATDLGGLTAWHLAAESDSPAALATLVEAGVDLDATSTNGMNTLQHAAYAGSVEVLEVITATGVELDAPSQSTTGGHGYPVDEGPTALAIAARAGHLDAVRALLELGAAVDAPSSIGQTALLSAIFSGQPAEMVGVLLDAGADPTVRAACLSGCAQSEGDALEWARRAGDPEVVALLEAALAE